MFAPSQLIKATRQCCLTAILMIGVFTSTGHDAHALGASPSELRFPPLLLNTAYTQTLRISSIELDSLSYIQLSIEGDEASEIRLSTYKFSPPTKDQPITVSVTIRPTNSHGTQDAKIRITPVQKQTPTNSTRTVSKPAVTVPITWSVTDRRTEQITISHFQAKTNTSGTQWDIEASLENTGNTSVTVDRFVFSVDGSTIETAPIKPTTLKPFTSKSFRTTAQNSAAQGTHELSLRVLNEKSKQLGSANTEGTVSGSFVLHTPIPWYQRLTILIPAAVACIALLYTVIRSMGKRSTSRTSRSRRT